MKWVRFDSQLGTRNGDLPQAFATTQLTVCRHFTLPVTIHCIIKINYTGRMPIPIPCNSFILLLRYSTMVECCSFQKKPLRKDSKYIFLWMLQMIWCEFLTQGTLLRSVFDLLHRVDYLVRIVQYLLWNVLTLFLAWYEKL